VAGPARTASDDSEDVDAVGAGWAEALAPAGPNRPELAAEVEGDAAPGVEPDKPQQRRRPPNRPYRKLGVKL
jgi:hypothetical protein